VTHPQHQPACIAGTVLKFNQRVDHGGKLLRRMLPKRHIFVGWC
jgi:hypothetical protein